MAKQTPIIGEWYQDAVEDVLFEVVAVDDQAATIEVQYADGELSEFDVESWMQMILLPAQAPDDWQANYESGDKQHFNSNSVFVPDNFSDPLGALEGESLLDTDDF